MRPDGTVPRLNRALMADSAAAMLGAAVGTSTTTSYIESASGIDAGGRTGLTALTVAVLFLLACSSRRSPASDAALRDGAGAALRRLPDDARPGRGRMGRHHRSGAGGRSPRSRCRSLSRSPRASPSASSPTPRSSWSPGKFQRHSSGRRNSRCAVRDQVHGHRIISRISDKDAEICLSSNDSALITIVPSTPAARKKWSWQGSQPPVQSLGLGRRPEF